MTTDEQSIEEKIAEQKIIEGPWKVIPEDHQDKHKRWYNNLIELLADLDHGVFEIPRDAMGKAQWDQMSLAFLIQWTAINANKITHKHGQLT